MDITVLATLIRYYVYALCVFWVLFLSILSYLLGAFWICAGLPFVLTIVHLDGTYILSLHSTLGQLAKMNIKIIVMESRTILERC